MDLQRIGVVGAGMMGTEIALVMALAGKPTVIADRDPAQLERAAAAWGRILARGVERGSYRPEDGERALANLTPVTDLAAFADRDAVIEAVSEDEAVKVEVFRALDAVCRPECVLASNTSSIPIAILAGHVSPERRPRVLGTHFFSPVSRMKLVEVIPAFDPDPTAVEAAMALCREAGKAPIRVKDVVGFAVNRLLHAFWIEAVRLVEEEVATPEDIDAACKLGLGHPVGPFELMDAVSNGLTLQVQEILHAAYGPRFLPRPLLKRMVGAGRDGRRAGRGWYGYGERDRRGG
jgi:3-hydroxybutyryl-CoA dehydrogenase